MNAWLRTPEAKTQSRGGSPSMVGQNYFRDEINVTFFEGTIQPYLKSIQTCMTFFLTWNTKRRYLAEGSSHCNCSIIDILL